MLPFIKEKCIFYIPNNNVPVSLFFSPNIQLMLYPEQSCTGKTFGLSIFIKGTDNRHFKNKKTHLGQ